VEKKTVRTSQENDRIVQLAQVHQEFCCGCFYSEIISLLKKITVLSSQYFLNAKLQQNAF